MLLLVWLLVLALTSLPQDRILPLLQERANDRTLVMCHSLIRRYLPTERRRHPQHFDVQALYTVVVSLNSHGADFEGGLYVSTGEGRQTIALQAGDAIFHDARLLHGVETRGPGARWSWIM